MRDRERRSAQVQVEGTEAERRRCVSLICLVVITVASLVVAMALTMPGVASAESICTDTWVGPAEGSWQTVADWSSGSVPTSSDVACIGSSKTVTVSATDHAGVVQGGGALTISGGSLEVSNALEPSSIHMFTLAGGSLVGSGTLEASSSFAWTGGEMSGSGSTVVASGASATLSSGSYLHATGGRSLVNNGTMTLSAGGLSLRGSSTTLHNAGTFKANSTQYTEIGYEESLSKVENTGVFEKNGSTEGRVEPVLENVGTVKVNAGTLIFTDGGSSSSASDWTIAEGTTLSLTKGSFSFEGSSFSVSGSIAVAGASVSMTSANPHAATMSVSGGTLTVPGGSTVTAGKLTLSNGSVNGSGTLEASSSFAWTGGEMSGSGSTVVASGASATLSSGSYLHATGGRSLVNNGTMTLSAGGLSLRGSSTTLHNAGTFKANSTQYTEIGYEESLSRVQNTGTFEKTEGTETARIEPYFENFGRIVEVTAPFRFDHPVSVELPETQYGSLSAGLQELIRVFCGDPVNCVTGNYTETQTDVSVGGRGVGLKLERTYNAQAAAKAASAGSFGYGWTDSFSDHLVVESSAHVATLYEANGSTLTFTESEGVFSAPARSGDTLTGSAETGYTVKQANQTKFVFNGSNGQLESMEDRDGNKTTLSYNEKGQLATITDPAGRKIKLAYNAGGQVETAEDPMGHVVKYTYESGNLTSVTLPGETSPNWRFKYDGSHRITSMINGVGGETVNTYDGSNRVTSQKDPLGHTLKWEYGAFQTKITNEATGAVTMEQFNSADLVTSITNGYGTSDATTRTISYNEHREPTAITDGNEHTTKYEYDSAGNRTKTIDPEGHETSWTYNSTNDVMSITRPNGEKTTIERDTHGNATLISRPAPGGTTQETHFEYNSHGETTSMTDPLGRKSTYEYDNQGDRTSETDPEGDKRTHAYNEDSQETFNVSPRGNIEGGESSRYTTTIERDAQGRPVKIIDPLGHEIHYTYDADGNVTATKDPNGHETKTTYNAVNLPTKVTEPNGTITETGYDGANQVTSQTDGNKHTTSYKRNVLEQVTEIVDPLLRKTTKTYDAAGNLASVTDAASRTTTYTYNKENQPTKIAYSDGVTPTVEYEYDSDGNRTAMIDGTGKTTYTYDQLDRLTKTKDGHGNTVGYEYDLANEQTKITYPNGKSVERSYDKAGRLHSVTDWLGHTTSFAYDQNSNLTATTFPTGTGEQDTYGYNEADQQTEAHMAKGEEVLASLSYTRDSNGQVTKTVAKGLPGAETTEYTYDENERLIKAGTTTYEYDAANNPTKTPGSTNTFDAADQLTEGTGVKYSYDEVGERTKATPTSGPTTTYGYNQAGDLTSVARPEEGETPKIEDSYAYNGDGLRASQTVSGTTHYFALDTTDWSIVSDEANSYIAGPNGVPVEQIDTEGKTLYLHHDQQGSTRMLTGASGTVEATMSFDAYGNPAGSTGTATTPLRYDGQYTNTDTGLLNLGARSYDPAAAQFTSIDPIVQLTQAPYMYAGDNPLTLADPSGLCSIDPFSSSSCVSEAAGEIVHVAEEHPVATGIGLGVAAVVTGGAAIAVGGGAAGLILGGASVAAGAGAAALDTSKCVNGDAAACVGAGLGLAAVGLSGPELAAAVGLIEDTAAYRALAGAGLVLGGYSSLYDLLSQDPFALEELLC